MKRLKYFFRGCWGGAASSPATLGVSGAASAENRRDPYVVVKAAVLLVSHATDREITRRNPLTPAMLPKFGYGRVVVVVTVRGASLVAFPEGSFCLGSFPFVNMHSMALVRLCDTRRKSTLAIVRMFGLHSVSL